MRTLLRLWTLGLIGLLFVLLGGGLPAQSASNAGGQATGPASPTPVCPPAWQQVPLPNSSHSLRDLAEVGADTIWAVGSTGAGPLALRWDGSTWIQSPMPPGLGGGLYGVDALAPNDIWAVGSDGTSGPDSGLVLHWDGNAWTRLPLGFSSGLELQGVEALSSTDVWAVGRPNLLTSRSLILHWDGSAWTRVPHPLPDAVSADLLQISAVAPNDIWAVGEYRIAANSPRALALHWDGSAWSMVPTTSGALVLKDVAGTGPNDVWAVGESTAWLEVILHWDGYAWWPVSPAVIDSLGGVAARAPNDAWAVGTNTIQHWDGSTWQSMPIPNPGYVFLSRIIASAPDNVWTVGRFAGLNTTAVFHYAPLCLTTPTPAPPTRTPAPPSATPKPAPPTPLCPLTWQQVPIPGLNDGSLADLAAVSANDIWAVGSYSDNTHTRRTLTMHWDGTVWSVIPSPGYGYLNSVDAVATNDVWAVGDVGSQGENSDLILHWDGSSWTTVPWSEGIGAQFWGVEAITSTNVWVVGLEYDPIWRGLILHWDGSTWSVARSPAPPGMWNSWLKAVSALAPDDIWAVGWYSDLSYSYHPFIIHWDGRAWSVVPAPDLPGGWLKDVAGTGPNDVWAVGEAYGGGGEGILLHWDGSIWQSVPAASSDPLMGVAARAPNDAWAVGPNTLQHWDGTTWQSMAFPAPGYPFLSRITALASNNVWTVGSAGNSPLVLHYAPPCLGATPTPAPPTRTPTPKPASPTPSCTPSWQQVTSPHPGTSSGLSAVAAVNANDIWAVGWYYDQFSEYTLTMHWNGTAWSVVPSPGYAHLYDVDVVAANDVWAVGTDDLLLHWDGSSWTLITLNPGVAGSYHGVEAISSTDVWVVGYDRVLERGVILHWDGSAWSVVPSPAPPGLLASNFNAISALAPNDIWLVGGYSGPSYSQHNLLTMHWDGSAWSIGPSPFPNPAPGRGWTLVDVAGTAPNDVWAVGGELSVPHANSILLHWNGTSWQTVLTATTNLWGIAALAPDDVWVVGYDGSRHWDGTTWQTVPLPNADIQLYDVVAAAPDNVWSVGQPGSVAGEAVILHLNPPCATRTPTPAPPTRTSTPAPSCVVQTPTRIATPAFTPAPGCTDRPRSGDLRAVITDHPTTTDATFTNRSNTCSYRIGLAIYKKYDANIDHQELSDYRLAVIPPNSTLVLTVNNPTCAYQGDAFWGDILYSFAGGQRYGARRLDDTDGHGTNYCLPACAPPAATATPTGPGGVPPRK